MAIYLGDSLRFGQVLSSVKKLESDTKYAGLVLDGVFSPTYLGKGTVWQRDISNMPIDPNSSTLATWMDTHSPDPWNTSAFGDKTALNTTAFGTHPVPLWVVDSSHPDCHYQYIDKVGGTGLTTEDIDRYLLGKIPMPKLVKPAQNQDRGLAIWDIGTGIIREYFMVIANGEDHWNTGTGGYSVCDPGFKNLAKVNYATQLQRGHNTVSCMHNSLGFIGVSEIVNGKIDHALAFTTANFAKFLAPSWPAKMSDGKAPETEQGKTPTHGQWARLPKTLDPMNNPKTGRPFNPLTRLMIKACQEYGMVSTDTNAWCHAFNAEHGFLWEAILGEDPWKKGGYLSKILSPYDPEIAFNISDFPWDLTEWAPVDWGRPSPDFSIRPGGVYPWIAGQSNVNNGNGQ